VQHRFPDHDVLYSDTDSLILAVRNVDDAYEIMKADRERFDMSGYDPSHATWGRFYDGTNKKKPGCFKDEFANAAISRFITIKPKMYALEFIKSEIVDGLEQLTLGCERKAKGVNKVAVKDCRFDDYVRCLTENA